MSDANSYELEAPLRISKETRAMETEFAPASWEDVEKLVLAKPVTTVGYLKILHPSKHRH